MNKKFYKIIILEAVILGVLLVCSRWLIFPNIAGKEMLHMQIAVHTFMIGLCTTIFSFLAIVVKRKWKTHKKYILIPVIFTVFGYLMQLAANEITLF